MQNNEETQKQTENKEEHDNNSKAKMATGTVKFFNVSKGFGFIKQETGKELFFHISETKGIEPKDGDRVEFEVGQGRKGPCAIKIKILG